MKSSQFRRRSFLGSLGLAGASTFLPSLARTSRAATVPKRLLIVYTGHGTFYPNWQMRKGAPVSSSDSPMDWQIPLGSVAQGDFSRVLAPFYDLRNDLTVLDGLAMHTAYTMPGDMNGHQTGVLTSLTGGQITDFTLNTTTHPSIDQIIGNAVASSSQIKNVAMSVDQGDQGYNGPIRDSSGHVIEPQSNAGNLYTRLFPGTAPVATAGPPSDAQLLAGAEQAMLSFAAGEFGLLKTKLSKADATKLDAHQTLMSALQTRLQGAGGGGTVITPVSCDMKPAAPGGGGGGGGLKADFDTFAMMAAQALHCNVTPVVTIQVPGPSLAEIGMPGDDFHQEYAHMCDNGIANHCCAAGAGGIDAQAQEGATRFHAFNAGLVADLASMLKQMPESDGSTLLDNTLVVWCGELATGGHDYAVWPVTMLGGKGMGVTTGRYVYYGQKYTNTTGNDGAPMMLGPGHNRLWVSVAQAMGLTINQVGLASASGKVYKGTVDLTGPLDRFKA